MDDNSIDSFFREKFNEKKIPKQLNWNKDIAWRNFEKNLPVRKFQFSTSMKLALAASIMAFCFVSGYLLQKHLSQTSTLLCEANQTLKEINLPGGNKCFLAPYSKMLFTQKSENQIADTLYIEGTAYIQAGKNLVVKAKNSIAICSRAEININAQLSENKVIISTISGTVAVQCLANNFPAVPIKSGEQYTLLNDGIMAFKTPNSDPNTLAWKTGNLVFKNASLEYVVNVLQEYYGICIKIDKEELKSCRIDMQLKNSSLEQALNQLKSRLNLKLVKSGLLYNIEGQGC